jgi:hypothetical protein
MLVLHPSTSTEMDGPLGKVVAALTGVFEGIKVGAEVAVMNGIGVELAICGVALATMITTGVAVKMDGVCVGGRNGVGAFPGWMIQPLHDAVINIARTKGIALFILFSS